MTDVPRNPAIRSTAGLARRFVGGLRSRWLTRCRSLALPAVFTEPVSVYEIPSRLRRVS
jgi:hypothetical protein